MLILLICSPLSLSSGLFKNISTDNGLPDNYVTSFAKYENAVWIGTGSGLAEYKNGKISKVYTSQDGLPSCFICGLEVFDEQLYIFTLALAREKCCAITKKVNSGFESIEIPENIIITDTAVWKNKIWMCTWNDGLFSFDPVSMKWEHFTADDGVVENSLISLFASDDYLFIGSSKSGFSQYNGTEFKTFNEHISQLINNTVSAIFCTEKEYYFGTYLGINIFSPYETEKNKWISYTTWKNRLVNNYVKSLYIKDSIVWIGTNKGLTRFDPSKDHWKSYTIETGLVGNTIFTLNVLDNTLWIGTDKGISIVEL